MADVKDAMLSPSPSREELTLSTSLRGRDLSDLDLSNRNLSGKDLSNCDLRRTNLNRAILRRTNLNGAKLYRATLVDADLRWARLRQANLNRADLKNADLRDADIEGAEFKRTRGIDHELSDRIDPTTKRGKPLDSRHVPPPPKYPDKRPTGRGGSPTVSAGLYGQGKRR